MSIGFAYVWFYKGNQHHALFLLSPISCSHIRQMKWIQSLPNSVFNLALFIQYTLYKMKHLVLSFKTTCWYLNTVVVAMLLSKCFFFLFIKKNILCSTHSKRTEQSLSKRWPGLSSLWKEQFFVWNNYY